MQRDGVSTGGVAGQQGRHLELVQPHTGPSAPVLLGLGDLPSVAPRQERKALFLIVFRCLQYLGLLLLLLFFPSLQGC